MPDSNHSKTMFIGIQLSLFGFFGFGIFLFSIPYEGLLSFINSLRPGKPYQFFTAAYHSHFLWAVIVINVFIFLLIILFLLKKQSCIQFIGSFFNEIRYYSMRLYRNTRSFFQSENKLHVVILLFMVFTGILIRLMYINRPVFHDEAKTFYSFISKSWVDAISNYYVPNNHVLHSILSRVFYVLLGNEEWVFRIPVFIFGILTILFIYIFSRRIYNKHIALILCALTINAIPLVSYSVNARGYIIVTLYFLILLCIVKTLREKGSILLWMLFVIIASLGVWTVPIMVMPLILLFIWYILNTTKSRLLSDVFTISLVGLACILLSFIFYSPVILRCGLGSIISNQYVQSQTLDAIIANLPNYVYDSWKFFTSGYFNGAQILIFLLFLTGIFYHLSYESHRKLLFSILLLMIIVFFILKSLPFVRTLLFIHPVLGVIVASGIFSLCAFMTDRMKFNMEKTINLVSIFLFILSTITCLKQNGIIEDSRDQTCHQAEKIIFDIKKSLSPNDMIETSTPLAGPIRYYLLKNNIDEKQFHWHNQGKDKDPLKDHDKIFIITRGGRNNLESFGYTANSSLEGYAPPEIWKEYNNTVKIFVMERLL